MSEKEEILEAMKKAGEPGRLHRIPCQMQVGAC